jgi:sulfur-oxidizing protein SoxY
MNLLKSAEQFAAPRSLSRRELLIGAAAGALFLWATRVRATAESMAAAMREVLGDQPIKTGRVKLNVPELAESGNSVPLTVTVESPMSAEDYVKSIFIFSEKNPLPTIAQFSLTPRSGRAQVSTRIRLSTSQRLLAVATTSDGTHWSGAADVVVTTSSCGD